MLRGPLLSALDRDEAFLSTVLHCRIDRVEVLRPPAGQDDAVTRVAVRGRSGKQSREFRRTLVIKRHPERGYRKSVQRDPAFCNEATVYSRVLPALLCDRGEAPRTPYCLHASPSVIVLDDLATQGFTAGDRLRGLDLDHAVTALQALGRFHALSLSLKHRDRSGFARLAGQVQEVVFVPEAASVFGASLEAALALAISSLQHHPEMVITDAVQMLQSLRGRAFRTLVSLVTPREPLSVICHGDFWINNIMFSYEHDKINEVAFTDLQVVRYSSLATDVLHFLYTSLEPGLTMECSDELIKAYHKSLSETLEKISPSCPPISVEEIQDEMESRALYGLIMCFLVLPNITNSAKDSERSDFNCDNFSSTYSQRVKNIVLEFVEKGFI